MTDAFVDTSVLLSLAFGEVTAAAMRRRLAAFPTVYASDLVEAELRSACRRVQIAVDMRLLRDVEVIFPDRTLRREMERVLEAGYLRGEDCFHLATALFLARDPSRLTFVTLDVQQREVAKTLGFAT